MLPVIKFRPEVLQYLKASLCNEAAKQQLDEECMTKFNSLLSSLSWPPAFTTIRLKSPASKITQEVKHLTTLLEEQYARKLTSPPAVFVHPLLDDCLVIENCGPCAVSPVGQEVMVDVACGMAVLRGADVFVQGIMAASPGICKGDKVSVYVDIDGQCRKGLVKRFEGSKLFIGNGIAAVSRQDLFSDGGRICSGIGVSMTEPMFVAPSLSEMAPELVFPQNLPSIVCVHVLDPQPGEIILDMCAAPGGKTTHIAALMNSQGRVIALDKNKNKIEKLKGNVSRLKLDQVEVYCYDGTRALDNNADLSGGPPYPPGSFDRILLDAPCSGLGQRPAVVNNVGLAEASSYPPLQKRLFEKAVALLRNGGVLVYSTCTITVEENESIVAWALRHFPCLKLVDQAPRLAGPGWPCQDLADSSLQLVQRFDPSAVSLPSPRQLDDGQSTTVPRNSCDVDTIGFFIAKFVKEDSEAPVTSVRTTSTS